MQKYEIHEHLTNLSLKGKLLKKLEDKEELKMACKVVSNLCCNKLCRLAVHDDAEALDTFVSCLWWSNLDESFLLIYIKALRFEQKYFY